MGALEMFSVSNFQLPSKEYSVMYCWVWNTPITAEEIDRQLKLFKKAGINGIYILPLPPEFRPQTLRTTMSPPYLSEEFFACIRHAMLTGKSLGMNLWLYDEGGWPSGGACSHTRQACSEAVETLWQKREIKLKKGTIYSPSQTVIAAFCNNVRITAPFTAETETVIEEYFTEQAGDQHPNRIDSTSENAVNAFIKNTYEPYCEAVRDLLGDDSFLMFTDEPSVDRRIVPSHFFSLFKQEYGYDATEYLPAIVSAERAVTAQAKQARIDYGKLLGKLFRQNYCEKLQRFCQKNNLRFGGHLDLDHIPEGGAVHAYFSHVGALRAFDVPGVDVIWEQIRYPYGGRSPIEEGLPFFPRLASSAARQTGKKQSLTETFGVYGDGITPDEMRYVLNYQAIRGINLFNFMTLPYGNVGLSAIGERSAFHPLKPSFFNLEHINRYYARLSYLLQLGDEVLDTALYHPSADFWSDPQTAAHAGAEYHRLGCELETHNIPFDIIDDEGLELAQVTTEGLKLGDALYRHIVLPSCTHISETIQSKIAPFLGAGTPSLVTNASSLRTMVRTFAGGTLYFVFNEGETAVRETLAIQGEHLYQLNLFEGTLSAVSQADLCLSCGDMAVFLISETPYASYSNEAEYRIETTKPQFISAVRSVLTTEGITQCAAGENDAEKADFSGELTYRIRYHLPAAPQCGERYRLTLTDTAVTARVSVNGNTVATLGLTPMQAVIDGGVLEEHGELLITVSNTFANEITAKQELIHSFPSAEIGPYNEKAQIYEQNKPLPQLGTVLFEKLK